MGSITLPKELPTINFSLQDLKPGTTSWEKTCTQVRHALEDYGCFVALYPQLSTDLKDDIFHHSKKLFELPLETKLKNTSEKPLRGYIAPIPLMSHYEATGIDNVTSPRVTGRFSDLMWPNGNPEFHKNIDVFAKLVGELEHIVEEMILESYKIPHERCESSLVSSNGHLLRFLKYTVPERDSKVRLERHTDKNFTTIVAQHDVGGLEVETKNGDWISFESEASKVLFMAGDGLEKWSNNRVRACQHRVKDCGDKTRYSLAMFTFNSGGYQVAKELVDESHPLLYSNEKANNVEAITPVLLFCGVDRDLESAPHKLFCGFDKELESTTSHKLFCGVDNDFESAQHKLFCGVDNELESAPHKILCGVDNELESAPQKILCGVDNDLESASHILFCGIDNELESTPHIPFCGR